VPSKGEKGGKGPLIQGRRKNRPLRAGGGGYAPWREGKIALSKQQKKRENKRNLVGKEPRILDGKPFSRGWKQKGGSTSGDQKTV